jgi:hypothetical protein
MAGPQGVVRSLGLPVDSSLIKRSVRYLVALACVLLAVALGQSDFARARSGGGVTHARLCATDNDSNCVWVGRARVRYDGPQLVTMEFPGFEQQVDRPHARLFRASDNGRVVTVWLYNRRPVRVQPDHAPARGDVIEPLHRSLIPWRPVAIVTLVALALVFSLRDRPVRNRLGRFVSIWSRRLLVAAWASTGAAFALAQLVAYDRDCRTLSGGGWHPIAVVLAAVGPLSALASSMFGFVETAQRRTAAGALTAVGALGSLYPLFVLGLFVLVGCDNS